MGQKNLSEVTVKFAENLKVNDTDEPIKRERVCCTSLTKGLHKVKPIGK